MILSLFLLSWNRKGEKFWGSCQYHLLLLCYFTLGIVLNGSLSLITSVQCSLAVLFCGNLAGRPQGGVLHVHGNVKDSEEDSWSLYVIQSIREIAISEGIICLGFKHNLLLAPEICTFLDHSIFIHWHLYLHRFRTFISMLPMATNLSSHNLLPPVA